MEFPEVLQRLLESDEFKTWHAKNRHAYLAHGFIMQDPLVKEEWQIGYFDEKQDKVITFIMGDKISINNAAEILKDDTKLLELSPEKIKTRHADIMSKCDKLQKEKYPGHTPLKKIILLQNLALGQVWNVTFVTNTFKILNIKLSTETGDVLKDELVELFRVDK